MEARKQLDWLELEVEEIKKVVVCMHADMKATKHASSLKGCLQTRTEEGRKVKSKNVNKKASEQSARISATMKKEQEASKLQECLEIMRYKSKKAKASKKAKTKQDCK